MKRNKKYIINMSLREVYQKSINSGRISTKKTYNNTIEMMVIMTDDFLLVFSVQFVISVPLNISFCSDSNFYHSLK